MDVLCRQSTWRRRGEEQQDFSLSGADLGMIFIRCDMHSTCTFKSNQTIESTFKGLNREIEWQKNLQDVVLNIGKLNGKKTCRMWFLI
jgi:hypothetical protein